MPKFAHLNVLVFLVFTGECRLFFLFGSFLRGLPRMTRVTSEIVP